MVFKDSLKSHLVKLVTSPFVPKKADDYLTSVRNSSLTNNIGRYFGIAGSAISTVAGIATGVSAASEGGNPEVGFAVPALGIPLSIGFGKGLSNIIDNIPSVKKRKSKDSEYLKVVDNFLGYVLEDSSRLDGEDVKKLGSIYRDDLKIRFVSEKLNDIDGESVLLAFNTLKGNAKKYATNLINTHLESMEVSDLPLYDQLLNENHLVQVANHYVQTKDLESLSETLADERISEVELNKIIADVAPLYVTENKLDSIMTLASDERVSGENFNNLVADVASHYASKNDVDGLEVFLGDKRITEDSLNSAVRKASDVLILSDNLDGAELLTLFDGVSDTSISYIKENVIGTLMDKKAYGKVESYVLPKILDDIDSTEFDGISKEFAVKTINDLAGMYFDDGNLEKAESLWYFTKNDKALKGKLLNSYQASNNDSKVVKLFTMNM